MTRRLAGLKARERLKFSPPAAMRALHGLGQRLDRVVHRATRVGAQVVDALERGARLAGTVGPGLASLHAPAA